MPRVPSGNKKNRQAFKTYFNKSVASNKKIKKQLQDLWREVAFLKYGSKCEYQGCYRTENLNVHHVFTKGHSAHLRFDIDNAMILCPRHHTMSDEAAHCDINFKDKILGKYPGYRAIRTEQWFELLERKAARPYKLDLELELRYLEKMKDELLGPADHSQRPALKKSPDNQQ